MIHRVLASRCALAILLLHGDAEESIRMHARLQVLCWDGEHVLVRLIHLGSL